MRCWHRLLLVALAMSAGRAATAAPVTTYVQVRYGAGGAPVLYLRFDDDQLRLAPTLAGLESATPIAATQAWDVWPPETRGWKDGQFVGVVLPITATGIDEVKGELRHVRGRGRDPEALATVEVRADLTVTRRDRGVVWEYLLHAGATAGQEPWGMDPARPLTLTVPNVVTGLRLAAETKVVGRKVQSGVRAMAGEARLRQVLKGGKRVPVTLAVRNRAGKVVVRKTGDLDQFGSTWSGPGYPVRMARRGRYTARFTAQLGPGVPLTTAVGFSVK